MRIIVSLLVIATLAICNHAQELTDPAAVFHPPKPAIHEPIMNEPAKILPSPTIMLAGETTDDAASGTIDESTEGDDSMDGIELDPYAIDGVDIEGLEAEKADVENGQPVSFEGQSDEAIAETINGIADQSDFDGIDDIDLDGIDAGTMTTDDTSEAADGIHDDDAFDDDGVDADMEGIAEEDAATDGSDHDDDAYGDDKDKDDKEKEKDDKEEKGSSDIDDDDEGSEMKSVEDMAASYNGVVSHPEGSTDPELGTSDTDSEGDASADSSISFTHELPTDTQGGSSEMIVPRWNRRFGKLKSVDIKLVGRMVGTNQLSTSPVAVRRSLSIIGNANIIVKGPSKFGRLRRFLRRLHRLRRLHGGLVGGRWSRFRIRRALMRARLAALRLAKHRRSSLLDITGNDFLNNHMIKSLILGKHNKKGMKLFLGSGKLAFVISKNIVPATQVDNVAADSTDLTHDLALGGHLQVTYHFKKRHAGDKLRALHKLIKYLRLPSLTRMRLLRLHKFFVLRRLEHKLRLLKLKMLIRAIIACKRLAMIKAHIMKPFHSLRAAKLMSTLPVSRRLRLLRLMRTSAIRDKPFTSRWRTARLLDPKIHLLRRRIRSLTAPVKDEPTKWTLPIIASQLNRESSRSPLMTSPILSSQFMRRRVRPSRFTSSAIMNEPTQLTSFASSSPVKEALPLVTRTHTGTSDDASKFDVNWDDGSYINLM